MILTILRPKPRSAASSCCVIPIIPWEIVWDPADLRRMAEICIANDTLLVSDEIHSDLIFHGKHHTVTASLSPEIGNRIITCVSATKTFNLAGLQASTTIFPQRPDEAGL